jgi:hypothetical protein
METPVTTNLRLFGLDESHGSLGLSCTASGVALAGTPLLVRTATGFQPRPEDELNLLLKAAYGMDVDYAPLVRGLKVAAASLNDGDVERAMVAALHLRLPALDPGAADRVRKVEDLIAKYSAEQPRDWHGRWTSGGDSGEAAEMQAAGGKDREAPASAASPAPKAGDGRGNGDGAVREPPDALPLIANQMRISPSTFKADAASPEDVTSIARAFIQSGAALSIRQLTEGDTREISGDVVSTPTGYAVENARWGSVGDSRLPVGAKPAPVATVPFYFHSHSSTPSAGSLSVDPGPSDRDVRNSHDYAFWQAVIDKDGYLYLINPQGGLVRSDGTVLPYAQAMRAGTTWSMGAPQTSFPNLENHANAFGHGRSVRHDVAV